VVKIITQGAIPPKYHWMRKQWKCSNCDTVVQFEEGDAPGVSYYYEGGARESEWVESTCPKCSPRRRMTFYPHKVITED